MTSRFSPIFSAICLISSSLKAGESLSELKNVFKSDMSASNREAKELASHEQNMLSEILGFSKEVQDVEKKPKTNFLTDDLLPISDKGKNFERPSKAEINSKVPKLNADMDQIVNHSIPKEQLEGSEAIFTLAKESLDRAAENLEIERITVSETPEETNLVTCKEVGTYQVSIFQSRSVKVQPAVTRTVHKCRGHETKENFTLKSSAEKKSADNCKKLKQDPHFLKGGSYVADAGRFKGYNVMTSWFHKDGFACDHSHTTTEVISSRIEEDTWQTPSIATLNEVQSNPNCSLLYEKMTEGASTRVINGESIYRDTWGRLSFFSCGDAGESKCKRLRDEGAVILKKHCLKETSFGECDLWEKTYDLGGKAAYKNTHISFKEEEIWGINNELVQTYDKNTEFGEAVSNLAIFSDISATMENKDVSRESTSIFAGTQSKCQRSFLNNTLYDCCKKMSGLAVSTHLACCNQQEKTLAVNRSEGKCHYVGAIEKKMGLETEHVYCCFPTKLSRVVHEEGRKQLKMGWGSAENPTCSGFKLDQLQAIDFTKMDLSEVIEDFNKKIDKAELAKKLDTLVQDFTMNGETKAKAKTERLVEKSSQGKPSNIGNHENHSNTGHIE